MTNQAFFKMNKNYFIWVFTLFVLAIFILFQLTSFKGVKFAENGVVYVSNDITGGHGTGFLIDENLFLTNQHVVAGAKEGRVITKNNLEYKFTIKLQSVDGDFALLQIEKSQWERFKKENKYVVFDTETQINDLDEVFTIGHPMGLLYSFSKGIVSSSKRMTSNRRFLIEVDANIFPGNSGGPLLNSSGEVVGMAQLMKPVTISSNMPPFNEIINTIGFALPITITLKEIDDYKKYNQIRKAKMGVLLKENAVIAEIAKNSVSEKSGFKINDRFLYVDNTKIENIPDLLYKFQTMNFETPATFTVKRDKQIITLMIKKFDYDAAQ
jgi:serine protease Do